MNIRAIDLKTEYSTLSEWWVKHDSLPVPEIFLEEGFMATCGLGDIACCFVYISRGGKIAMVEYITTNPIFSFCKVTVEAVHKLLSHAEQYAKSSGCSAIISMTKPNSSEERIMGKCGYATSVRGDEGHRMFGKQL